MAMMVRDVMTRNPVSCETTTTIVAAARMMRDHDIGDVLVCDGQQLRGIVTDRDIVVRCIAGGADVGRSTLGDVCTGNVMAVSPDSSLEDAARTMRECAVRRLPVIEDGRTVGIVSLGDLVVEVDPRSVLADISAAEPNV